MTRTPKIVGFLVVTLAGVWGCAKVPTGNNAGAERNATLEAKAQRLEEDFRAAATARDQFRQKLLAAEEKIASAESRLAQLQKQFEDSRSALARVSQERDALRTDLQTRTAERDNVSAQYESFRKSLRDLLGQAESALAAPRPPALATGTVTEPSASSALRN